MAIMLLDLSDCVNLLNLNLAGTQMTALNIQSLIKLHNFDLSDSQIAELKAAKADRYTNGYNWSWQSAKLDLTEGTSEGQLMAGVQNYFATAEIPDELAKESSQLARGTLSSWSGNSTTLNLGNVSALDTVVVESYYPQWYGTLSAFTVEISTDGATYTQVAEYTDLTEAVTTVQRWKALVQRHVKITVPGRYKCIRLCHGKWLPDRSQGALPMTASSLPWSGRNRRPHGEGQPHRLSSAGSAE